MTTSACIRCGETYRISETTLAENPEAMVQCPWCAHQSSLREVINELVPELILITESPLLTSQQSETNDLPSSINFGEFGAQPALDSSEINFTNPTQANENPTDGMDGIVPSNWQGNEPIERTPLDFPKTQERTKQKSSGIGTMIGVVLGGLASLPLAGLILLALGRAPDLGFWPFDGNEPTRRSAAPLPTSTGEGGVSGTPLRFNQSFKTPQDADDPSQKALDEILGSENQENNAVNRQAEDAPEENSPEENLPTEAQPGNESTEAQE